MEKHQREEAERLLKEKKEGKQGSTNRPSSLKRFSLGVTKVIKKNKIKRIIGALHRLQSINLGTYLMTKEHVDFDSYCVEPQVQRFAEAAGKLFSRSCSAEEAVCTCTSSMLARAASRTAQLQPQRRRRLPGRLAECVRERRRGIEAAVGCGSVRLATHLTFPSLLGVGGGTRHVCAGSRVEADRELRSAARPHRQVVLPVADRQAASSTKLQRAGRGGAVGRRHQELPIRGSVAFVLAMPSVFYDRRPFVRKWYGRRWRRANHQSCFAGPGPGRICPRQGSWPQPLVVTGTAPPIPRGPSVSPNRDQLGRGS